MQTKFVFNGNIARAARALVGVSAGYLGKRVNVARQVIRNFEKGTHIPDEETQGAIRKGLIELGAVFLPEGSAGGAGVRLKYNSATSKQVDRWEGEGGPAGEDDG